MFVVPRKTQMEINVVNFVKSGFALFFVVSSLGLAGQRPATALCSPSVPATPGNPTPPPPPCSKPKPQPDGGGNKPVNRPPSPQPTPTPKK